MITAHISSKITVLNVAYKIIVNNIGEVIENITPAANNTVFYPTTVTIDPGTAQTIYAVSSKKNTLILLSGIENYISLPITLQETLQEECEEVLSLKLHLKDIIQNPPKNENTQYLLKQRHYFDEGIKTISLYTKVSIATIPTITPPITGQTPVTNIDCKEYSGNITWIPTDPTFMPGKIYTATLDLVAKHGYVFDGIPQIFFAIDDATVTNNSSSGLVTATFPITLTDPSYFTFDDNTNTVTAYDEVLGGTNVFIPLIINGKPVENIATGSFNNITNVKLPKTLLTIADSAFVTSDIANIVIPSSVTNIGAHAFSGCTFSSITIGRNTTIASTAFGTTGELFQARYYWNEKANGTYLFNTPNYPNAWIQEEVGEEQFFKFDALTRTITDYDSTGGTSVIIPASLKNTPVQHIGANAFKEKQLTNIRLPSTLQTIGMSALEDNDLNNVILPGSLTSIDNASFASNNISSIYIPRSINNIGDNAFLGSPLTNIFIGENVAIGNENSLGVHGNKFKAKYDWNGKRSATYIYNTEEMPEHWNEQGAGISQYFQYNSGTNTILGYDESGGTNVYIPTMLYGSSPKHIAAGAFRNKSITNVTISETIITIGEMAFENNVLTNVTFPDSVTNIANAAFANNTLNTVNIGYNVTIGNSSSLGINGEAFKTLYNTERLSGKYTYTENTWLRYTQEKYFTFAAGSITGYNIAGGLKVSIPPTINGTEVLILGESAFREKIPKITSVTIPNTVTTVNRWAFLGNAITNVNFGAGVQTILESAFHTNLLTNIELPDSLTNLGPYVFWNTPTLVSVKMPANASINWALSGGSGVFGLATQNFQSRYDTYTTKAAGTYVYNTSTEYPNIWINQDIPLAENFFAFNDSLKQITAYDNTYGTNIVIPEKIRNIDVENIGTSAFQSKGLSSVQLPSALKTIAASAFRNNPSLTAITIPSTVTHINSAAFWDDSMTSNLTSFTMLGTNVSIFDKYSMGRFGEAFKTRYDNYTTKIAGTYAYNTSTEYPNTWIIQGIPLVESFFAFNDSLKQITAYDNTYGTSIVIPEKIRNIDVENIGANAFLSKNLSSVQLPSTLKTIGVSAFQGNSLSSIEIPPSVTTISDHAFYNAPFTSITIGDGVVLSTAPQTMGTNSSAAFITLYNNTVPPRAAGTYNYSGGVWTKAITHTDPQYFTTSIVNANEISIDNYNTAGGLDVIIPEQIDGKTVTALGSGAFMSKNLTSIVLPNTLKTINAQALRYNTLSTLTIPNTVTLLGNSTATNNQLTSLIIGNGIATIPTTAFQANTLLNTIILPENIRTVSYNSFNGCPLTSITIGTNVTLDGSSSTMGSYGAAFATCYNTTNSKSPGIYTYTAGTWQKA